MFEHARPEVPEDVRDQLMRSTKAELIDEMHHVQTHADELLSDLGAAEAEIEERDHGDAEALAIARCAHALDRLARGSELRSTSRHAAVIRNDGPPERSKVGRVLAYLSERYGQRPPDERARRLEEDLVRARRRIDDLESQLRNVNASIFEEDL